MGFWTLGPILGSLVATTVSGNTLGRHTDWRFRLHVSGFAGLLVFVIALIGLRELSPALRDHLKAAPAAIGKNDVAYLTAHGGEVAEAARDNPRQGQTWWWVCVAGQLLFLPCVFLTAGRWHPRRVHEDERAHNALVERELAALRES
ncbi:hypothetical protein [Streptomyces shenzhenensis]|uniref:hypothetical protein n=1 Tax=Streptomyces shenzhenensis TaxID=943815 RepID=UPI0015F12055|nr:hypothetical protein [Streptomyces shenzhenensis]